MKQKAEYITEAEEMLGNGYEPVRIKDESKDHKYFTITPRIVKAFSRNSHDFSFWDTVKDVAGESGECYLNTEQLAILSGISTGQVVNSRKYWLKIGFLTGGIRKDPGYSQAVWHLSVPDIWQKNVEWCEKYPKIAARLEFRKSHLSLHRSLHSVKPSLSEGKGSRGETKKIESRRTNKDDPEFTAFLERWELIEKLYSENVTKKIVPIMSQILSNIAKTYEDSTWYEPAFVIYAKNTADERGLGSFDYFEKILATWKEKGRDWTPEYGKKTGKRKEAKPAQTPQLSPEEVLRLQTSVDWSIT